MIRTVVVEDEPIFRESLVRRIDSLGDFKVEGTASNGIEGLIEIQRTDPHVVFSDIRMPGMDGLVFLEQIRKDFGDLPVVFITGFQEFEYAQKALRLGAVDLLMKPLDADELHRVVEKLRLMLANMKSIDNQRVPPGLIAVAKEWVCANLKEASLNAAAAQVQMNPAAFSRKFHASEGVTFIQYVSQVRMNKAKELLANPIFKVAQVAELVGYLDQRYFTEVFKKTWGLSPQEYRKTVFGESSE